MSQEMRQNGTHLVPIDYVDIYLLLLLWCKFWIINMLNFFVFLWLSGVNLGLCAFKVIFAKWKDFLDNTVKRIILYEKLIGQGHLGKSIWYL